MDDLIATLDRDIGYVIGQIRRRHLTNGGGGAKYHKRMAMRLEAARKRIADWHDGGQDKTDELMYRWIHRLHRQHGTHSWDEITSDKRSSSLTSERRDLMYLLHAFSRMSKAQVANHMGCHRSTVVRVLRQQETDRESPFLSLILQELQQDEV